MKIEEVVRVLNADVYYGNDLLDVELNSACAADMMSDVLAFLKDQALLISGLCNPQVVRTADMMDIKCIALVRGKVPTEDMIRLAREKKIAIISSKMRMYIACGKLYESGLKAGEVSV
ncbi:MAG: DRTGG domain-containing protein [Clostridia bacterium]